MNTQPNWSADDAWRWYDARPWLCGFNFVPSTAVNSTELWQRDSFDRPTIERELGWAAQIGFRTCRVFLQYLVWEDDPGPLLARVDEFLGIASRHNLSTMLCLFDDCAFAGEQPYLGKQADPAPGVHNSGWTPCPGHQRVVDQRAWPMLEKYITGVVSRFANDSRVLAWDLYNEPGNAGMADKSLPLVERAFAWARSAQPQQPLTAGVWTDSMPALNDVMLGLSDIVSFHSYGDVAELEQQIERLQSRGRPVVCTEWMRRPISTFATHLPVFQRRRVGCYSWGLVNGRTQTHFPWGSPAGAPEPAEWFHDLLRADGTPYREDEVALVGSLLK